MCYHNELAARSSPLRRVLTFLRLWLLCALLTLDPTAKCQPCAGDQSLRSWDEPAPPAPLLLASAYVYCSAPPATWLSRALLTLCSRQVPYICNLAVLDDWRGRGVGSALLQACEGLVSTHWSNREIYLHASTAQERLLEMYRSRGYSQLPEYDQPDWVLAVAGREATTYHRKAL